MAWTYLIIAGLIEVIGVIGLKRASEKDNLVNNLIFIVAFIGSFQFLSLSMQEIPLATAYAVWTGIGTLGSTIVGIFFFHESKSWLRIICILGIMSCIIALRFVS